MKHKYIGHKNSNQEPTDFNSSSLVGLGHVPGSRVTARKKLYAQSPTVNANIKCDMEWDWASARKHQNSDR